LNPIFGLILAASGVYLDLKPQALHERDIREQNAQTKDMARALNQGTFSKVIDWILFSALLISILLPFLGLYVMVCLAGLFVIFLALLRVGWRTEDVAIREIIAPDTLIARIEDCVTRLREAVDECFAALDLSKRVTSPSEHALQVGASLYFLFFLSMCAYRAGGVLTLAYGGAIFIAWAGLLCVGLFLGKLYTAYVKTVSSILAARNIRNLMRSLASQTEVVQTHIKHSACKSDDLVSLRDKMTHLEALTDQLLKLENRARTRATGFRLRELLIAVATALPSAFTLQGVVQITVTSIVLVATIIGIFVIATIIGICLMVIIPDLRAHSLLRVLGIGETGEIIRRDISSLQAMVLDEETSRLVQSSFLFTQRNANTDTMRGAH
jgi:hypothetical protein